MSETVLAINEDAEILAKLGILTSTLDSPKKKFIQSNSDGLHHDQINLRSNKDGNISDDEESDSNMVYAKRSLLGGNSRRKIKRQKANVLACRILLLSASFFILGLSISVIGVTLPNIAVSTNSSSLVYLIEILCWNAVGFLIGILSVTKLLQFLNPLFLIILFVFGTLLFTFLVGWTIAFNLVVFYVFVLGIFHGLLYRGATLLLYGCGYGTCALFATHACFAFGATIAALISTPMLSNAAIPFHKYFGGFSDDNSIISHLLNRRQVTPIFNATAITDSSLMVDKSKELPLTSARPKRPDHVVGLNKAVEPKSVENMKRRKEVEQRLKEKNAKIQTNTNDDVLNEENESRSKNESNVSLARTDYQLLTPSPNIPVSTKQLKLQSTTAETTTPASKIDLSTKENVQAITTSYAKTVGNSDSSNLAFLFSELNWNMNFPHVSRTPISESANKNIDSLNNVRTIYVLTTALSIFCFLLFLVYYLCSCGSLKTISDFQLLKLSAVPEKYVDSGCTKGWHISAGICLSLFVGVEQIIGGCLTLYALTIPEVQVSQQSGALITASFWLGVFFGKLPTVISGKLIGSNRLMHMAVGALLIADYIALSTSSIWALNLAICVLGVLLSSLSLTLLCWLDEQQLTSRMSLSLLFGVSVGLGRLIISLTIALAVYYFSVMSLLFVILCVCILAGLVALLMTIRCVNTLARYTTMKQLTTEICDNDATAGLVIERKQLRNGAYVALVDENDLKGGTDDDDDDDGDSDEDEKVFLLDEVDPRD